jgi:hypothetical protein
LVRRVIESLFDGGACLLDAVQRSDISFLYSLLIWSKIDHGDGIVDVYAASPFGTLERRAVFVGARLGCLLKHRPSITKAKPLWLQTLIVDWLQLVGASTTSRSAGGTGHLHPDLFDSDAEIVQQQEIEWQALQQQLLETEDPTAELSQQQQQQQQIQQLLHSSTDETLETSQRIGRYFSNEPWPTGDVVNASSMVRTMSKSNWISVIDTIRDDCQNNNAKASIVIHRGQLVAEEYNRQLGITASTRLAGGRLTNIINNALLAIRVRQDSIESSLDTRGVAIEWLNDERKHITINQLSRYVVAVAVAVAV